VGGPIFARRAEDYAAGRGQAHVVISLREKKKARGWALGVAAQAARFSPSLSMAGTAGCRSRRPFPYQPPAGAGCYARSIAHSGMPDTVGRRS
jgi:hypothetical protein